MTPTSAAAHALAHPLTGPGVGHRPHAVPPELVALADGVHLLVTPLSIEHEAGLAALFQRLGPESRYRRFLSPKPRFTPRELAYLTRIDGARHVAIGAIDPGSHSIVGAGHYVRDQSQPEIAEVAMEIADEVQGKGIGTALVSRLVEHAGANGVTVLRATTLWENRPSRALLRRSGFRVRASHGAVIEAVLHVG